MALQRLVRGAGVASIEGRRTPPAWSYVRLWDAGGEYLGLPCSAWPGAQHAPCALTRARRARRGHENNRAAFCRTMDAVEAALGEEEGPYFLRQGALLAGWLACWGFNVC